MEEKSKPQRRAQTTNNKKGKKAVVKKITKRQAVDKQTSKNQRQPAKKQTSKKESANKQTSKRAPTTNEASKKQRGSKSVTEKQVIQTKKQQSTEDALDSSLGLDKSYPLVVGMRLEGNYRGKDTWCVDTVSKNYRGASTPSTKANTAVRSKHVGDAEEAGSPYRRSKRKRRPPSEYWRVAF